MAGNINNYSATVISASTAVKGVSGLLGGIFVSAASNTPTITIYDGTSTSGTALVSVFTPVAGTFYPIPAAYGAGLYVAIGGTISCTVFWN